MNSTIIREDLSFVEAIEALIEGERVSRIGWYTDVYLYVVRSLSHKDTTFIYVHDGNEPSLWKPNISDIISDDWCTLKMNNKSTIDEFCAQLINKQTKKGVNKYGVLLDDANLSECELITHAQEEIVDLLKYLEALKRKLEVSPDTRTDY